MDRRAFLNNPYRPGAGHMPPFMAGRTDEQAQFRRVLRENNPTANFLITGLRGFGKTVLLDCMRQMAQEHGWIWVGNDLSESASLSEERLSLRILTDLAQALTDLLLQHGNGAGNEAAAPPQPTSADDFGREQQAFDAL